MPNNDDWQPISEVARKMAIEAHRAKREVWTGSNVYHNCDALVAGALVAAKNGEHWDMDRAMDVLRAYIKEYAELSPAAWYEGGADGK